MLFRCEVEEQVLGKINGDFTDWDRKSHNSQVRVELHQTSSHTTTWLFRTWQTNKVQSLMQGTQDRLLLSADLIELSTSHLNNCQCKHTSLSCSCAVNANEQCNHKNQMDQLQPVHKYSWGIVGYTFMHFCTTEGQYSGHRRSCWFWICRFGDHYEWNKVTTCVHNILSGQRWIEHYGEVTIRNMKSSACLCKLTFVKVRNQGERSSPVD